MGGTEMTAQINDIFEYRGTQYSVAGISEGQFFDPDIFGLEPQSPCTACLRGYQAIFTIFNSHLVLETLHVSLFKDFKDYKRKEGPAIKGITPTGEIGEQDWFNNHYEGLNYDLEYSGGLLLANGFIRELYVPMDFQPAWKYQKILELVFSHGVLQNEFNRSERMAEIRQKIIESYNANQGSDWQPSYKDILNFVEGAFNRSYNI